MEMAGEQRTASKKCQKVYEQLGAPVLLFRNVEAYQLEEAFTASNNSGEAVKDSHYSAARLSDDGELQNRSDTLEKQSLESRAFNKTEYWKQKVRKKIVDKDNGPSVYGNCLLCFACFCHGCRSSPNPSTCLLHPIGVLLDRVKLSFLALPRGRTVAEVSSDLIKELDVGDTVRQLQECGEHQFVARTDVHCTVFSVEVEKPETEGLEDDECSGMGRITQVHRIDLRSFSKIVPSYRPIDLACHPKYGRGFTKPNIAVLTEQETSSPRERKTIHHIQCGQTTVATKHTFLNLLEISLIDFTATHPMVLWAAGRSHVRPALSTAEFFTHPRIGYGSSLFTLDLRSNLAVFQWSPSKEGFLTEGAHGISGMFTDWRKPHSLWLTSTSAAKTWEMDSRMPCSPITTWSLSHACDEPGVVFPSTGLYGAGTLYSQPLSAEPVSPLNPAILTVDKSPGAFGLHLFQRPETGARFQTNSIECVAGPSIATLENASIAVTSTFALPDVSDSVFTCGLSSFRAPTHSLLSVPELVRLGFIEEEVAGTLCVVTLTSKGDVYAHSMLESNASHKLSRPFPSLPVGASMIAVPEVPPQPRVSKGTTALQVKLCNEYPVPSSAYILPAQDSESELRVLNLPLREDEQSPADRDSPTLRKVEGAPSLPSVGVDGEGNVAVQTELYEAAEERLRESLLSFEPPVKSTEEDPGFCRSDVTPGLIQKASSAWGAEDSDDDDSGDDNA